MKYKHPQIQLFLFFVSFLFMGNQLFAQDWSWAAQAGGSDLDSGNDIIVDANGYSFVIGDFEGTANFGNVSLTSNGLSDIFLSKYDHDGHLIWVKQIGSTGEDEGLSIGIDGNQNLYITGAFENTVLFDQFSLTSFGDRDIFLAKYDGNGNAIWANNAGGNSEDTGTSLAVDENGNIYLTGEFRGEAQFGNVTLNAPDGTFNNDLFVAKYNTAGLLQWIKDTELDPAWPFASIGMYIHAIKIDGEGNSFIAGQYLENFAIDGFTIPFYSDNDLFLIKINDNGEVQWLQWATSSDEILGQDISIAADGSIYLLGILDVDAVLGDDLNGSPINLEGSEDAELFLAKYTADGSPVWGTVFEPDWELSSSGSSICSDNDGNLYISAKFEEASQVGKVLKVDQSGVIIWEKELGETATLNAMDCLSDGTIFLTGSFSGTINLDNYQLTSAGGHDVFVAKLESQVATSCNEPPQNLIVNNIAENSVTISWDEVSDVNVYEYILGSQTSRIRGNTTINSVTLTGLTSETKYLFKMKAFCSDIKSPTAQIIFTTQSTNETGEAGITIYPNPTQELLKVNMLNGTGTVYFKIISLQNHKTVISATHKNNKIAIDISKLNKGLYLLQMSDDQHVYTKRFSKE